MENSNGNLAFDAVSCPEPSCSSSTNRSLSSSSSIRPNNNPESSRISPDQSGLHGIGNGQEQSLMEHVAALQAQVDELKSQNLKLLQQVADLERPLDTAEPSELESSSSLADESRLDSSTGLETSGSEALPDIFGNLVILNRILEQLPNRELLKLSLVNKLWKQEARIVMKKRGNVIAALYCNGSRTTGCGKAFEAFAENLDTLKNEPFYSGMTIRLGWIRKCEGTGALEVERIHEKILAGMRGKMRQLSIQLDDHPEDCWNNPGNCPDVLLLRLLLRDFVPDLEHLNLEIWYNTEPFVQLFLPPGPYPKLKVLKLGSTSDEETFGNQIRMLLSWAPNLKEIHTRGRVSLRENLMEGREGVVHVHEYSVTYPVQNISESVIPSLRLKWMKFFYTTEPGLNLDRFNAKTQSLLRTCCATTLHGLELDAVSTVLFMSYGIPLDNVKRLGINFDYLEVEQFDRRILRILSRFDFTHLLPNLDVVDIWPRPGYLGELSRDNLNAIIEQGEAVPKCHRAGKINILNLMETSNSIPIHFLARMFPTIQKLRVGDNEDEIFPVEFAWKLWPDLEKIFVDGEWCERP